MAVQISPYINFDGEAADAIAHYGGALGAEVVEKMRFADMKEHPFGPAANDRIMHATLKVGEQTFMLSDVPPNMPFTRGGVHVSLGYDDVAEMTAAFQKLAEGGHVTMDLHDAFWGSKFGMLTDKFGVSWMLSGPRS